MQIHRYDSDAHGYNPPKIAARAGGEQAAASGAASTSSHANASKSEISDSRTTLLVARLKALPSVRSSAIEAAREKMVRGEFTTPEAARQLAASTLRTEIF